MGLFGVDSSNNEPVPGGSLTKPVLIALGALLVGRMFSGKSDENEQPQAQVPDQTPSGGGLGDLLGGLLGGVLGGGSAGQAAPNAGSGGLGGLLDQLKQAGLGDKVESWVGGGNNAAIEPDQLGNALGQNTISDIARQAGVNEQDLLAELSAALPGIVDKLTANGQVPDMQQLLKMLSQK